MRVILLQDVAKIGRRHQVVTVPDGYAANLLIPTKKAIPATDYNLKQHAARQTQQTQAQASSAAAFAALVNKLATSDITITAEANQDGTLFEAVKPAAIAKELGATPDEIPWITIPKPIKSTGKHTVQLVHGKEKVSGTIEIVAATK